MVRRRAALRRRDRQVTASRHRHPWVLRNSLVVFLFGAAAAAVTFVVVYQWAEGSTSDRFDVAIKSATAVAAVAAGLLTWGRLELSRHEHRLGVDRDLTERYSRAIDQIGSSQELVRVGGIFALERFALDAAALRPDNEVDWHMALDVIAAVARNDSRNATGPLPDEPDGKPSAPRQSEVRPVAPTTVKEALRVIGRFAVRSGQRPITPPVAPDLTGALAPSVDLRRVELTAANLTSADLAGANLRQANLGAATLAGANCAGADLADAQLTGARLNGTNLSDVNLKAATLVRASCTGADLKGADLTGAKLADADLAGADLTGAKLADAELPGADLTGAKLADAELPGADLTMADLTRANLKGVDLTGAKLAGADLAGADLGKASLSLSDFAGADLSKANLNSTNLYGADLTDADLYGATLRAVNLSDADLSNADLYGADLTGTNLRSTILRNADLYGADLTDVDLTSIQYDQQTDWPENFSPPPREPETG